MLIKLLRNSIGLGALSLLLSCARSEPAGKPRTERNEASAVSVVAADAAEPPPRAESATSVTKTSMKEHDMLQDKPYLSLRVETEDVPFYVYVNGGLVTVDESGTAANETWPINQLLRSGTNEVSMLVFPYAGEEGQPASYSAASKVTLTLLVRQADDAESPEHQVSVLRFSGSEATKSDPSAGSSPPGTRDSRQGFAPSAQGDVTIGPVRVERDPSGMMRVTQTLRMPLPFLEWDFFRSDDVGSLYELTEEQTVVRYEELLSAYEVVWRYLRAKDVDGLMPLFEERSREVDRAMYREPGTTQRRLREAFESALHNPKVKLMPVRTGNKGYWNHDVGPTGKLMLLGRGDRMSPMIRFENKQSAAYATVFQILFRKQGNKYIIAR